MRKKRNLSLLLFLMIMVLTACSEKKEEEKVPQFLDVTLTVNPEQGKINEPITFMAKVMYGDKAVTDPDKVEFEIWRANDDSHEKIPVDHAGDGEYHLKKSFTEEGTYYVYAHVTAQNMHSMPKKEFVIGKPSEPEVHGSMMEKEHSVNKGEQQ